MGKPQRKVVDSGIDLEGTRDRIVEYLFSHGVDSARIPPEPDSSLPTQARAEAAWDRAYAVASVHMMLHGVPCRTRAANGDWEDLPRCLLKKCNLGAASFALYELYGHWCDHERRDLESAVAEALAQIESLDPALLLRVEQLAEARIGKDEEQLRRLISRARDLERQGDHDSCARMLNAAGNGARMLAPGRLTADRSIAAVNGVRQSAIKLRTVLSMIGPRTERSHAEPPGRRRGRPKQTLRKALLQHLKAGGLSYATMSKLVVGATTSRRPAEVRNQLHQAARGRDIRGIRPYED